MNTRLLVLAALLAFPLLSPRSAAQPSEPPAGSATLKGRPVDLMKIRGTEVVGRDGDELGEVADVALAADGAEVAFLVVQSDGWFHRDAALIPAAAVVLDNSPQPTDLPRLDARAWWDGRRLQLSLEEGEFDDLASYQEGGDISTYLERNAAAVARAFGLSTGEIYDEGASYELAFQVAIGEDAAEDELAVAPPPPRAGEEARADEADGAGRRGAEALEQARADAASAPPAEPLSRVVAEGRSEVARDETGARADREFEPAPLPQGDGGGDETLEAQDQYVAIGGQTLAAQALIGVPVVNGEGEELGSIDDIVVNVRTGEAEFLVVETDDWFRDKAALLPVGGVGIQEASVAEPGVVGDEAGTRIALDISSQGFEEIADYAAGQDVTGYIRSRGAELAQRFGSGKSVDRGARYRLVFGESGRRG